MNTTLLIMAAGIGSRFGTGIKQLEPVDASNHIIMDYSIHDAIEAGFKVVETKNIVKTATGAEADGVVVDVNSLVSMNMWGLTPDFLDVLENGFKEFFEKEVPSNPQKAEYLIPIFIGELLEQGKMSVKVLKTNDTWYGMTYHEDVVAVKDSFKKMLADGVYKADLFADL